MQPRSLQQVLTELDSVYSPQINSIRERQSAIPGQLQAEEQGLQAKQQTAFGDILNGARRRGTGVAFGGIPMQEQARYTADNYLPALARLRQSGREQAMSLEDAILGINERRQQAGQGIYQNEQSMFEQRRQFDAQQALAREQMAAQQREAAASRAASAASSWNPIGAGPTQSGPMTINTGRAGGQAKTDPLQQDAYNFAKDMGGKGSTAVVSDFNAAKKWYEKTGNQRDLYKLQAYKALYPQWLGTATWKQNWNY